MSIQHRFDDELATGLPRFDFRSALISNQVPHCNAYHNMFSYLFHQCEKSHGCMQATIHGKEGVGVGGHLIDDLGAPHRPFKKNSYKKKSGLASPRACL